MRLRIVLYVVVKETIFWKLNNVMKFEATSHKSVRARDHCIALQALSLVGKAEPVQVCSHYAQVTNRVIIECKMDVKSTWIPTWHQMDHFSWSFRIISDNHFLEVGLTKN